MEGKEREEGGTKHTELNHGNQTHNKVSTGRQAASRSVRALLVRQWASLNTAPCTLIIRRTLKAKFMLLQIFFFFFNDLTLFPFFFFFPNLGCLYIAHSLIDLCVHFSGGLLTWTNSCDFLFPVPMYEALRKQRRMNAEKEQKEAVATWWSKMINCRKPCFLKKSRNGSTLNRWM